MNPHLVHEREEKLQSQNFGVSEGAVVLCTQPPPRSVFGGVR